ncbi:MAG: cache domain-containing protein, partial [Planctomycetota bacterium]
MDAARYARVRDLFLAAEELPVAEQATFLRDQTGDDTELLQEVLSLLGEHDAESARLEGERHIPLPPAAQAITPIAQNSPAKTVTPEDSEIATSAGPRTTHGDTAGQTRDSASKRKKKTSQITQLGAQRTHASPRETESFAPTRQSAQATVWAQLARQSRRRTSGWLWLAALLPTALVGWWTYAQVESIMHQSVRNELQGVADSVGLASERFLSDKAQLVRSWARQPGIKTAIEQLVANEASYQPPEAFEPADPTEQIRSQLQQLSGSSKVEFIVWSDSYRTITFSGVPSARIGQPVAPQHASHLTRVMSGETVLLGPERANTQDQPVMAMLVPIADSEGTVIAALQVQGVDVYDDFNRMFMNVSLAGKLDTYAVDRDGIMITESPQAARLAREEILGIPKTLVAANLRVVDPGIKLDSDNVKELARSTRPLTIAVAEATNGVSNVRIEPYKSYAGTDVVGAWRWHPDWDLGVIIERDADVVFAPARIVRLGFVILGSLLFFTGFFAAARIAKTSTAQRAAIHTLTR